jgi:hypothetical protein
MAEMDYIELSKVEKIWAPAEYAWECVKCPQKIRILDGHIDPLKRTAISERCEEAKTAELFRMIGIVGFGQKLSPKVKPSNEGLYPDSPRSSSPFLPAVEGPPMRASLPAEAGVTACVEPA